MKKIRLNRGVLLATAAAVLIINPAFSEQPTPKTPVMLKPIKCFGVNSCRGRGQCGTKVSNTCAGQNSCKGTAWLYLAPEECQKRGGKKVN